MRGRMAFWRRAFLDTASRGAVRSGIAQPNCVRHDRTSELSQLSESTSAALHVGEALRRCREVAVGAGVPGLVLTSPGAVAWATGGVNVPIDRAASTDVVWLAIGPHHASLLTTNVEAPRIAREHCPGDLGLDLTVVPWFDATATVR